MFDTKLPPGVAMLQPFAEDSSIKKIGVQVCIIFPVNHGLFNTFPLLVADYYL